MNTVTIRVPVRAYTDVSLPVGMLPLLQHCLFPGKIYIPALDRHIELPTQK